MTMTDPEHAAFLRGFDLAQPPGPDEADALDRVSEFAPAEAGQLLVAVSQDLARAFLSEVDALPEDLAGAAWSGFLRGLVAQASGAQVYVHHGETA